MFGVRKKRMRIANRYEFPSDRRQISELETLKAAVGGLFMRRVFNRFEHRKRRLIDS